MLAYVTAGMILAPMIGAIAGGYLYEWYGWQSVMLLVLAIGVLVTGACIVALGETNTRRTSRTSFRDMARDCARLLRKRRFLGYALQVAFTTASFFTFLGGASAVAVDIYGRSPSEYALWFILVSGSYMTGNFISGRISRRVGIDRMITIGTVVSSAAALVMMILFVSGWFGLVHFFLLAGMMSLGNGFSMPQRLRRHRQRRARPRRYGVRPLRRPADGPGCRRHDRRRPHPGRKPDAGDRHHARPGAAGADRPFAWHERGSTLMMPNREMRR